MGDQLGGRPKEPHCYDVDGKVNYGILGTREFFLKGIERLETAYDKDLSIAIMCSESKPAECHRTHLIGKALVSIGIQVQHIDEKGILRTQDEILRRS